MTESNGYLRRVAEQIARHDEKLDTHGRRLEGFERAIDGLSTEIRELRDVLHGDGKDTPGLVADIRDAGKGVAWMRRLAWLTAGQAVAIVAAAILLVVKLGVTGGP